MVIDEYDGGVQEDDSFYLNPIEKGGWISLGVGLLFAAVAYAIPYFRYIVGNLIVLVHEVGHSVFMWIYGYPSIPQFDLTYGGGFARQFSRQTFVIIGIYALMVWGLWIYRRNWKALALAGVLILIHSTICFTTLHEDVILFMGHGTELFFAWLFLYRAISNTSIITPFERPLYAMCGFFILIHDTVFGYKLVTDNIERIMYGEAKGGGHWMDFSRIAARHSFLDLVSVATIFLACCAIPLVLALAVHWFTPLLQPILSRVTECDE